MISVGDIRDILLEHCYDYVEQFDLALISKGMDMRMLLSSILERMPQDKKESDKEYRYRLLAFVKYTLLVSGNDKTPQFWIWLLSTSEAQPSIFKNFWYANRNYIMYLPTNHVYSKLLWSSAIASNKHRQNIAIKGLDKTITPGVRSWIPGLLPKGTI